MNLAPLLLFVSIASGSSVNSLLGSSLGVEPASGGPSWGAGVMLDAAAAHNNNTSTDAVHRIVKRQLVNFPDDAIMGFYFKLVVPYWTFPKVTTKGDYRVEVTYELPTNLFGLLRRKRSLGRERSSLFSLMEDFFYKAGLDGTACVLRAVCEMGEAPLEEYGLLGEFITLVFAAGYKNSAGTSLEHVQAEEYGRSHGGCWSAFPDCPMSVREVLHEFFLNNGQIPNDDDNNL